MCGMQKPFAHCSRFLQLFYERYLTAGTTLLNMRNSLRGLYLEFSRASMQPQLLCHASAVQQWEIVLTG